MFDLIRSDIQRLSTDGKINFRVFFRGLLSQGFQAILVYRVFSCLNQKKIPSQPFRFFFERFIEITTGISIPAECRIGSGFKIHHFGGIIFHPSVNIGKNCTLYHHVTIGDRGGEGNAASIGDHVLMGAGAKIIGEISIGNHCKIGANAVVNENVPDHSTVIGNPCRIIQKDEK